MSILGGSSDNNNNNNMGSPSFRELKKQASFFFKERIKTARLALTDVTPAQLLAEEVTVGNQWAPDTQSMRLIAKAAFEVDDYWRIVDVLHKRFSKFDRQNWRVSYNSLILLEHLLTHGPKSAAEEFQNDKDVISEMENFQHTDDKGFNWGLAVRKKSERVFSLLENRPLLKQERDRARKVTLGIQGFGSFGILEQSSSFGALGMSDCLYHDPDPENNNSATEMELYGRAPQLRLEGADSFVPFRKVQLQETWQAETCHYENTPSSILNLPTKFKNLNSADGSKPLLDEHNGKPDLGVSTNEDLHPFCHSESQASASLFAASY